MEAVRKMKGGKCEEAVQLLRDANMRYKNEPEAAFNVQMASFLDLAFMILTLFTMICSIQVSDSIPRDVCIKDCVINQCMKASKKATPAICDNPCKYTLYCL
ncbi:PREDICTED: uncharacterized protein LOC106341116 [Brassica oleracea var. oleracea]|nr:PREDICTED: uncharacterized protein LOC106341116 [Brassica oleracea var. oleracea]